MDVVDCVVIGAGVVGLATARALSLNGFETLILDGERHFGSWTSSRNSEVIHAGLYYPEGSLKAALCVEGKALLYSFCAARGVPHRRCGKLIVAADDAQRGVLDGIDRTARQANVEDLRFLESAEAKALEPAVNCAAALLSPSTGIVDSHAYMLALLGEAEAHGAMLVGDARVTRVARNGAAWDIHIADAAEPALTARHVVNAAGLGAQEVAAGIDDLAASAIPPLWLAKGVYFTYSGRMPFSRLIYPVPEPGGLGTHLTLDLAGQGRFGPDVEWVETIDYHVDPGRHTKFAAAARRIWPALDPAKLEPGYAGIRPKLSGPGMPAMDFVISGPGGHGLPGIVNLFGIESPGLTASLALAERVVALVGGQG